MPQREACLPPLPEFFRSLLSAVLSQAGYEVTTTHNGQQALAAITAKPPDLLVTDLNMPKLDGRALIRAVQAAHPDLPIIILTGRPPQRGLSELAERDAAHMALLEKPASPYDLLASIRSLLAR